MTSSEGWLRRKLNEPCACLSGRPYRKCCMRKEVAYLIIGIVAAILLFLYHNAGIIPVIVIMAVSLAVGILATWLFDRGKKKDMQGE